jgi:hypothetical protein
MVGVQLQQAIVRHSGGTAIQQVNVPAGLAAGTYFAEITAENGRKEQVKITIQ